MLARLRSFLSTSAWIIRFKDGAASVEKGTVPSKFVSECNSILGDVDVDDARIEGARRCGYIGLEFSKSIPPQIHQKLRNIWSLYNPDQ